VRLAKPGCGERIEAMEAAVETGGAMAGLTAATPSRAPGRSKHRQQSLCERGTGFAMPRPHGPTGGVDEGPQGRLGREGRGTARGRGRSDRPPEKVIAEDPSGFALVQHELVAEARVDLGRLERSQPHREAVQIEARNLAAPPVLGNRHLHVYGCPRGRDERWLPFEGQGAVSAWTLELNPASNNFDFSTITDVVLHVRYTARLGIAESTVLAAIAPTPGVLRSILVSARNTFGDAYYRFFNPTSTTATQQTLTLPITKAIFPFSNLGSPTIKDIDVFFVLAQPPATGTTVATTFGATSGTAAPLVLAVPLPGSDLTHSAAIGTMEGELVQIAGSNAT